MLLIMLCCCQLAANAQYFDLNPNKKRVNIPFRMIRDMVIIQMNINNKGPFNFILDTGVGLMLITDPKLVDSINIVNKRTLKIAGIGEGSAFEAYATSALNVGIPGLTSYDVAAAILKEDHFGLSNYAGIPIHGLLGYEFFNNLAVKINFADSIITVTRPRDVKALRKGSKIPMTIEDRKPYIKTKITYTDGGKTEDKLILDLGAGHALSLENAIKKYGLPQKFITANLGVGLTGPVSGFLGRVSEVEIGKFKLKDVITSFPTGDQFEKLEVKRDGNLGIGVLKRFTVIIDYPDTALYLKSAANFKSPFEHDMSGMEYFTAGDNYDRIIVSRVEPGSPADAVGIEPDDEIMSINLKPVKKMSIEQIDAMFKSQNDRSLLLDIHHEGRVDVVIIRLKRRI